MNRNDPRGDGDQSPLSGFPGSPGADLEMLWGCGGNFNPFERRDRYRRSRSPDFSAMSRSMGAWASMSNGTRRTKRSSSGAGRSSNA